MASDAEAEKSENRLETRPTDLDLGGETNESGEYQGPHDWRKRLRPVQSPIKAEGPDLVSADNGERPAKETGDEKIKVQRSMPPWKRDLIERNKRVARLVRRESSGRSKKTTIVRRESSGRSKRDAAAGGGQGVMRKKSFNYSGENPFTQQVVNEGQRKRISPANSFKGQGAAGSSTVVRRTPSDKVVDPNSDQTKKRIERALRARLYLLQQMGPNSFLVGGDSPDHKFRVIIGQQTCSCGKGPHCVHVLFVMLRVFSVSEGDPCLWSKTLKNYEVENLFRIYHDRRSSRILNRNQEGRSKTPRKPSPDRSNSPSPGHSVAPSESDAGSTRDSEDDTCPICLLEMVEGESLLKCENGCHNRYHHHCLTVWFEECRRQNDPLICPLCRAIWKSANVELKNGDGGGNTNTPVAPPNTRVSSPLPDMDVSSRLPYAEPIPQEFTNMAAPWIQVLGEDLVSCLFSRNWSIRETGMKHFGKEIVGVLMRGSGEGRTGVQVSQDRQEATHKMVECCCSVLSYMCSDPVYRVFVASLKVLRTVLSFLPCRDEQQRSRLQLLFKPVVDTIIIKCTDGNKRTSQLSLSTMVELAKGQNGELAVGREIVNPGIKGLGGVSYVVQCCIETYNPASVTWQWLLGRLVIVEKLFDDFPSEFLPRPHPDGASSESSLEAIGAASADDEECKPLHYDRLVSVAKFAFKGISNAHVRIGRLSRRTFLLAARFASHVEGLLTELEELLNSLDSVHAKPMKRKFAKIVEDFELSERIVHELHHGSISDQNLGVSPVVTPSDTPCSSPRPNSPVSGHSHSDCLSEASSGVAPKSHMTVPPNTPIRGRKPCTDPSSFQSLDEESIDSESLLYNTPRLRGSALSTIESLPELSDNHSLVRSKVPSARQRSRSRSKSKDSPHRARRVLETDIDEAIRLQEEQRKRRESLSPDVERESTYGGASPLSIFSGPGVMTPPYTPEHSIRKTPPPVPPKEILSQVPLSLPKCAGSTSNSFVDDGPRRKSADDVLGMPENPHNLDLSNYRDFEHSLGKSKKNFLPKMVDNCTQTSAILCSTCLTCAGLNQRDSGNVTKDSISLDWGTPQITYPCSSKSHPLKFNRENSPKLEGLSKAQAAGGKDQLPMANQSTLSTEDLLELSPITPKDAGNEKPVTFHSEVAGATPKHSPSHTLDKDDDDEACPCKEEVEKEEALALVKAMEVSSTDTPRLTVPGLTPTSEEEVITIRIQPDDGIGLDSNGNQPRLYLENTHWVKGPLLGTGAYSTCYQSRDVKTGVVMAVKQISYCRNSRSEQEKVVACITEEIHMMAKLSHPNVVRIMGATRQGCHFNMFVEWMAGGSVSYLLGQYGPFCENVITSYTLQTLRGLAYLHDNQILHRDLKGANLLVDSTGQRLRIGDFGAAARLASRQTGAGEFQGELLGTIAFMAPEVLRGNNYGRACDVWSVGCCMIEMTTTKPPWDAHDISNHLALIFKIATSVSTPPIPDNLSPPVRDLMLRCLEQDKSQRPTAKELLIHPLFTQFLSSQKR